MENLINFHVTLAYAAYAMIQMATVFAPMSPADELAVRQLVKGHTEAEKVVAESGSSITGWELASIRKALDKGANGTTD